ncbi:unnamed protein product [Paramecium octaurelia]|uniref:Uncharacterized protein n=1 Tax=Paramecium octaurelia TaxID=43137 RepID=A0A8S1YS19_PAROT|nr:unnamed protein product [Paramecium octaurelia]CAD8214764.1 unnamed protein product [Paramecium octaurelia]
MNQQKKHEGFTSDDSVDDMSVQKIESSNRQSTIRCSNQKSSDESITDMIKKIKKQINKKQIWKSNQYIQEGRKIEEFDFEISNLQQELELLKESHNKKRKNRINRNRTQKLIKTIFLMKFRR